MPTKVIIRRPVYGPMRKHRRFAMSTDKKMTVAKQTKKNTKAIKQLKSVGFQYCPFYKAVSESFSGIHGNLLTQPNNWEQCFRTHEVADADLPRQYHLKSVNVTWSVQAETTETGNLWVQIFAVSLKNKTAAQVIERTTRLSNLTEDLDYISAPAGTSLAQQGYWAYKLNPALYTVHYQTQRRVGQVTMDDVQITNIRDSTTSGRFTVKFPRIFKNDQTDDNGFKGLSFDDMEPRQHLYLLAMTNASSTVSGGECFWSFRADFNGHMNLPD